MSTYKAKVPNGSMQSTSSTLRSHPITSTRALMKELGSYNIDANHSIENLEMMKAVSTKTIIKNDFNPLKPTVTPPPMDEEKKEEEVEINDDEEAQENEEITYNSYRVSFVSGKF